VLSDDQVALLMARALEIEGYQLTVDLEQSLVIDAHGFSSSFETDPFKRHCLLEGLDDIALTLQYESQIIAYEQRSSACM
jgi:3-isopropylmalate/(R)-2-methylmalate dehydratase small subunit